MSLDLHDDVVTEPLYVFLNKAECVFIRLCGSMNYLGSDLLAHLIAFPLAVGILVGGEGGRKRKNPQLSPVCSQSTVIHIDSEKPANHHSRRAAIGDVLKREQDETFVSAFINIQSHNRCLTSVFIRARAPGL